MEEVLQAHLELEEYFELSRVTHTLTRCEEFSETFGSSTLENGHAIYYQIRETLAKLDGPRYHRSYTQRMAQEIILSGLARLIYGPDLRSHEIEVLEHNNFESLQRVIGMTMPRRGGKTEGTAQLVAALLLCVPNIRIIAVAPSSRAAGGDSGLMGHVKRILNTHLEFHKFRANEETLRVEMSPGDVRLFQSYPGGAVDT